VVKAIAQLWEEKREAPATLVEIALRAGVSLREAATVALLVEREPWIRGFASFDSNPAKWQVGGSEEVWNYRECGDWDDYVRIRVELTPPHYDQFGQPDPVKPFENPVSFVDSHEDAAASDGTEPASPAATGRKGKAKSKAPFQYDVAVSFAGEQRTFVAEVVEAMKAKGIRVFYDYDEQHELWGKDLIDHLDKVYRKNARYCVVFASADYQRKHWTSHERKSAQAREFKQRRSEYVLPIRMDDTDIPGLLDTKGYIDGRRTTPEKIAEALYKKLQTPRR
jgi:hypothetical protein